MGGRHGYLQMHTAATCSSASPRTVRSSASASGATPLSGSRPTSTATSIRTARPQSTPITTGDKTVIRLSVVPDSPPVVGAYLYSSQPLDPSARIRTEHLRAFRRVGRTNRQVSHFMWLRPRLSSDPILLIELSSFSAGE